MRTAGFFPRMLFLCTAISMAASCGSEGSREHRWYPNGKPRNEDWHSPVAMLQKYDSNHDGTVTRAELEAGLKTEFAAADKNHSGCLDADEVRDINETRTNSDESAASPLIDWENKGCIDFNEYAATARSLFEQLDRNSDGRLEPDELHPPRRHGQPTPNESATDNPGGGGY